MRSVDLNLFDLFETTMRNRGIATAARELNMTPSAVSRARRRLRRLPNDLRFNLTA
jgi:DNA-binding transcriptional LysR family regulator